MSEDANKLNRAVSDSLVARLAVLRGFPTEPLLREEITHALKVWCVGSRLDERGASRYANEQCRMVIDDAILTLKFWNAPSQLKEIYDRLFPWADVRR